MDPTVLIPTIGNLSTTAGSTQATVINFTDIINDDYIATNCTGLNELDLEDVFTKMDVGNAEFWGSKNAVWTACLVTYLVLFYAALLVLFCIYIYLLCDAAKQAYPLRTLMYLLTTYIIWSSVSFVHGILIAYSIASDSEPNDRTLAAITRISETIASSSFVSVTIVTLFTPTESNIRFSLRYALLSTLLIYLESIVIVVLSIPIGDSFMLTFAVLIIFRSLMLITSVLTLIVGILFKHSIKTKENFCLLWKDSKLLVIALPYFLLSYTYFLYTLATIVSNNRCIENIQLDRVVWLILNSLLRMCEVSFSVAYFIKATMFVNKMPTDGEPKRNSKSSRRSITINFHEHDTPAKPVGRNITDLEEEEPRTESCPTKKSLQYAVEKEHPHFTSSLDVETLSQSMSLSTVTTRLHQSVDSDRFLDAANVSDDRETTANNLDVLIIHAQLPVETEYLIGDIEARMFDERGGVFHSYRHGVTVIFPTGAIPSGILAELIFAATLASPVPFSTNNTPVSAIYWLCMDAKVELQKHIEIRLPLMRLKNQLHSLKFAKSLHSQVYTVGDRMKALEGGNFIADKDYASLKVDHFCYYCIVYNQIDPKDVPHNQYLLVAMKQLQPNVKDNSWNIHICLVPNLRTCNEHLKKQYKDDWEYRMLAEFSFEDDCDELEIELVGHAFGSTARVEFLSDMKVKQEDVDFHQYYSNGRLEELKSRMDKNQYPPRCKAIVKAKHKDFFTKSRSINFQITCSGKYINGKIDIPQIKNEEDLSEPDSPQPRKKRRHVTSGYESDDSIEHLSDEDEFKSGKLQLQNLMALTNSIKSRWFELGAALSISIGVLENLEIKYGDYPIKALTRVYRYWLSGKNGLQPTREKLIAALTEIDEHSIAAKVAVKIEQPNESLSDVFPDEQDDPNKHMKILVMKHVQPKLLDVIALLPLLNKYLQLTRDDNYILLNPLIAPTQRAMALLYTMLPGKGPKAYIMFARCLKEEKEHTAHQEMAQLLFKSTTTAMETTV